MIKVGLIGAGYIGPIHLEALTRIGGIKVDTVIDANRQIDVIHNCTPNKFHYEINKKALQAGKHILSEKPLAMSTQEAEELVELAEKKGSVTGIDFCYRYYPVVQDMAPIAV